MKHLVFFFLNLILPTTFTLRNDESEIVAVMFSTVDDLLYCYLSEGAEVTNSLLPQFSASNEDCGTFRFRGKKCRQEENFGINVWAKDNAERLQLVEYDVKQGLTRKATEAGKHHLRCVTQSIAWISRQNTTRSLLSHLRNTKHIQQRSCSRLART